MKGFTLVEILVTMAIIVMITGFLIANFSRARVDLGQTALEAIDAIRQAQSLAISGALFTAGATPYYPCGYGIHFDQTSYLIYAGPNASTTDCTAQNRNYDSGIDAIVRSATLGSNVLEYIPPQGDIFFEPPNPTTYINNSSATGGVATVRVHRIGAACPSADCRIITVTASGRIQSQ